MFFLVIRYSFYLVPFPGPGAIVESSIEEPVLDVALEVLRNGLT